MGDGPEDGLPAYPDIIPDDVGADLELARNVMAENGKLFVAVKGVWKPSMGKSHPKKRSELITDSKDLCIGLVGS